MCPRLRFSVSVFILVLFILMISAAAPVKADWNITGNPICTATGGQQSAVSVPDGAGGAIVFWADSRDGQPDIYVQRIDTDGNALWTTDGVPVCVAPNWQGGIRAIADGSGGAYAVWQDYRNGSDYDIYIQRVDASGSMLWDPDGTAVIIYGGIDRNPVIASDGLGGAIVVWEEYRSDYTLLAQRLDPDGNTLWAAAGQSVCSFSSSQRYAEIADGGSGGAVIAWVDGRNGNNDVYAQRIGIDGSLLWNGNGIPVATGSYSEWRPQIAPDDSDGAIIIWEDLRTGEYDIYANRVSSAGSVEWGPTGLPICTASGTQSTPKTVPDGSGGAIVAWMDNRTGLGYDVYSQRVDNSGAALWSADGVYVCINHKTAYPRLASDGSGGAIISWADLRWSTYNYDIYAQRVDSGGSVSWRSNGEEICHTYGRQFYPCMVSDGSGGAIICWEDQRAGEYDIYSRLVTAEGSLPPECSLSSSSLDFGSVAYGSYRDMAFVLRNIGYGTLSGEVTSACADFSIISGGGSYALYHNSSVTVVVRFDAVTPGVKSCTIMTGSDLCGNVEVTGIGEEPPPACDMAPGSLDFGTVFVGEHRDETFQITNTGGQLLTGEFSVPGGCPMFTIVSGGEPYSLAGGESRTVTVRYAPPSAGTHLCNISTGATCGYLYCEGIGEEPPACDTDPESIGFGTVCIGSHKDSSFVITNTGGGLLTGNVSSSCPDFSIVSGGGPFSLAGGQSVTVTLRFAPSGTGTSACFISTGSPCGDFAAVGVGEEPPLCGLAPSDLDFGTVTIGYFVDTTFTITNNGGGALEGEVTEECGDYEIISGGGSYSLTSGQSRIVTVRFAPLTAGTIECSIPTGGDCGEVHLAGEGEEEISVAVQQFGSSWNDDHAEIFWELADVTAGMNVGFDVSRSTSGVFERMPEPDIRNDGTRYTLRDYSTEPGRSYAYQVVVIEGGRRITSFETVMETPVYALTLWQNSPNPFNPSTTIAFALPERGRVVLEIFDICGRHVKTLADEVMPAGRHEIVWNGTDGTGRQVSSGIYFSRLLARKESLSRKMILLR